MKPSSLWSLALVAASGCAQPGSGISRQQAELSASTGSLSEARAYFAAVRLANGKVLVAGGRNNLLSGPQAHAELYDPGAGTWSPTGSLAKGRYGHVAALVGDGLVIVTGGKAPDGSATLPDELYDPASGAWSSVGSWETRYLQAATKLADGSFLVAGGADNAWSATNTVRIYDPTTGSFAVAPPLQTARYGASAATLQDGRVLVVGGNNTQAAALTSAELFDPASMTWSAVGSLSAGRVLFSLKVLVDGRVLAAGGGVASTEIYDPATQTWSPTGSLAQARTHHSAVVLPGGRVAVFGGYAGTGTTATVEVYDPATGIWTPGDPMLAARQNFGVTALLDGSILLAGGAQDANYLSSAERWQPPCAPTTCAALGIECGTVPSGCGGLLACGSCSSGFTCVSGACTACTPTTCAAQGKDCGALDDGCGGTLQCGDCSPGTVCTDNLCVACVPTTCAAAGAACGSISDGCGGSFDCGQCSGSLVCSQNQCSPPAEAIVASYDSFLKAPHCELGRSCDSGTLLNGRATKGPEANAPNTINNSCADGASGTYHSDESLDRLKVSTLDGSLLAPGQVVQVDATVWTYSTSADKLDLYHAANANAPSWTLLATLTPSVNGASTLTTTFTLPTGTLQALRGRFRYGGSVSPCTVGNYDDHDDLVFAVRPPPDLAPPTVAITQPVAGATVRRNIELVATADDDVSVSSVEFFVDGAFVGGSSDRPYTVVWSSLSVANGPHTLLARAIDRSGKTGDSAPVLIEVANDYTPPTTAVTAPVEGATVRNITTASASASDAVGISKVEFYLDSTTYLGTKLAAPYSISWSTRAVANGAHTLTSKAYDLDGNSAWSQPVSVLVDNDYTAPVTGITAPTAGATLSGTVAVAASASDAVGVTRVEFYAGPTLIGTVWSAPYSVLWNTLAVVNGSYTVTSKAYDAGGNVGTSAGVAVSVSNTSSGVIAASYDSGARAPKCSVAGSGCDSGTLLNGRATKGPEANAPNTINGSCADGGSGTYHSDESLDRLKISTLDGSALAPGKTVRIEATVWAYSGYSSDKLDLYYAANASSPSWVWIATLTPSGAGSRILTATYTLPVGAVQAVRGTFRYGGSAGACTAGAYDDHDDLVFATQ